MPSHEPKPESEPDRKDEAASRKDAAVTPPSIIRVEMPIVKVTFWAIFICAFAACLVTLGFYIASFGNRKDLILRDADPQYLKANLQDVSALFTYHLNMIAIVVGLASVAAIAVQVFFQLLEAKRKADMREQDATRNQNMNDVMLYSGHLIKNMAAVTDATANSMRTVNALQEQLKTAAERKADALKLLRDVARFGLEQVSINKSSFKQDILDAYSEARNLAQGVAAVELPSEYVILRGLYHGGHHGKSLKAFDILTAECNKEGVQLDRAVLARTFYFRGHFALRLGRFDDAEKLFKEGQQKSDFKAGYELFAAVARLFDLRSSAPTAAQAVEVEKLFQDIWDRSLKLKSTDFGKLDPKVYWEQLGHTYAALLVEGVTPALLPTDPAELTVRVLDGLKVADTANAMYKKAAGADSGAFDAVRYEAGLTLNRLGDPSKLLSVADLKAAIDRCGAKLKSGDLRERIVFATRIARFHGRLAAEYLRPAVVGGAVSADDAKKAEMHEARMDHYKGEALAFLESFKEEWDSKERVYSVFTNLYEEPSKVAEELEADIKLERYRATRG